MKKSYKASGVTLLEIMLVLAVAAMVIVMSIRYYKNASNSSNANAMLDQINAIIAAADEAAQGAGGSYASVATTVPSIVGTNNMSTPYNTAYTVAPASGNTAITITWGAIPQQVCSQVTATIVSNAKITTTACSGGVSTVTYTPTS